MTTTIPKTYRLNGHAGRNGKAPAPPFTPVGNGDRGAGGKFVAGNQAAKGHGNPHHREMSARRRAFCAAVTPEDVQALARSLLAEALAGNVQAAALVLQYAIGRPRPAPNPDEDDLDEFALIDRCPTRVRVLSAMMDLVGAAAAAEMARGTIPADAEAGHAAAFKDASGSARQTLSQDLRAEQVKRIGRKS